MRTEPDLPLLRWKPPVKVILFPLVNCVGKVRHVAGLLVEKQGDDATRYWKQVVTNQRKSLDRLGVPVAEQDQQLRDFWDAVNAEMVRLAFGGRRNGGDAA